MESTSKEVDKEAGRNHRNDSPLFYYFDLKGELFDEKTGHS